MGYLYPILGRLAIIYGIFVSHIGKIGYKYGIWIRDIIETNFDLISKWDINMDIMNINGISNQTIMYSHGVQWVIMDVNTIWNMNGCVWK
jgi:hypothetical protein